MSDPSEVLFDYSTATPDAIRVATEEAIERCDTLLAAIVGVPDAERTFANTVLPLDDVGEALSDVTGHQAFLARVMEQFRQAGGRDDQGRINLAAHDFGRDIDLGNIDEIMRYQLIMVKARAAAPQCHFILGPTVDEIKQQLRHPALSEPA